MHKSRDWRTGVHAALGFFALQPRGWSRELATKHCFQPKLSTPLDAQAADFNDFSALVQELEEIGIPAQFADRSDDFKEGFRFHRASEFLRDAAALRNATQK